MNVYNQLLLAGGELRAAALVYLMLHPEYSSAYFTSENKLGPNFVFFLFVTSAEPCGVLHK